MTAKDICPAAEEYQAKVAEAKAKAAAEQQEGGPAETAET